MRYVLGAAIAFFLAIFQASSVEQVRAFGVVPSLMLVLLVMWLVVRGFDDVLPMIAVTGITMGFIGLQTPGLVLIALLIAIVPAGIIRELHVINSEPLLALFLVFSTSIVYESVVLAGVMATGGVFDLRGGFGDAVLPAAVVNVIIAPPVYLLMRLARPPKTRNRLAY